MSLKLQLSVKHDDQAKCRYCIAPKRRTRTTALFSEDKIIELFNMEDDFDSFFDFKPKKDSTPERVTLTL